MADQMADHEQSTFIKVLVPNDGKLKIGMPAEVVF